MSTCGEVGSDEHALIEELAIKRVDRRSEIHSNESQHLVEGTKVARLRRRFFFFTACTFITRASSSLQTGGGACEYPTAPFARPGVCTRASYRGVTGSEKREGVNEVGSGIGVGGGNGDGNGVRGGNGKVDGDGDGNGAEKGAGVGVGTRTGTVVEANERMQYLNRDWSGGEAGTGTGREWRPVDEHRTGTGMGVETETREGTRTGSGRAEERQ